MPTSRHKPAAQLGETHSRRHSQRRSPITAKCFTTTPRSVFSLPDLLVAARVMRPAHGTLGLSILGG